VDEPWTDEALMRWNELADERCSIARTVSVIGDRWTLLILRDCFLGIRRFEAFEARLGITRHILADRLKKLVDEGVLKKVPYRDRQERHEYRLTQKPEPRVFSDGEAAVTQDTSMGSIKGWTIPLMVGQPGRDRPWTKSCVWSGSTV
jgi:DNA-binding HxlR family transcriptional regulator